MTSGSRLQPQLHRRERVPEVLLVEVRRCCLCCKNVDCIESTNGERTSELQFSRINSMRRSPHAVSHFELQSLRRRPVAHRDLQQPAAADQRERLARGDVPVRALELADACGPSRGLLVVRERAEQVVADVRRRVAEVVDVDDPPAPSGCGARARCRAGPGRRSAAPARASGSPAASIPATGARMSRPWKRVARLAGGRQVSS